MAKQKDENYMSGWFNADGTGIQLLGEVKRSYKVNVEGSLLSF